MMLYPQLLNYECSNVHSNKQSGNIHKINLYNRIVDKMQINLTQRPVELPKICDRVFDALDYYCDTEKLYFSLKTLRKDVKGHIEELLKNISCLEEQTVPVRAEFRFKLNTITSMVPLVDYYLSDELINDHVIILTLSDVTSLLKHWVVLLYSPIMNCLALFNCELRFNYYANTLLQKHMPTISAFESLIVCTLFGGEFKSFLGKTVWSNKRIEEEFQSLHLKQSMLKYNRLNFSGSGWSQELKLIQGSTELLDFLLSKYKIKKSIYVRESYQLLSMLGEQSCIKAKAKLLWDSYFNHLFKKFAAEFDSSRNPANIYSLDIIKTSRTVHVQNVFITFAEAIQKIFDLNKLDNKQGPQCWNLPYLICYQKLAIDESLKEQLDNALLEYAINNIEYIHEAGARHRFFKQTDHNYTKLCLDPSSCNEKISVATSKKMSKTKRPKHRYCQLELNLLCVGLNYFRGRRQILKKIERSRALGFSKEYHFNSLRTTRSNMQLGSLRAKLQNSGELLLDHATNYVYHIHSTLEECSPVEGVDYSEAEEEEKQLDELDKIYLQSQRTSSNVIPIISPVVNSKNSRIGQDQIEDTDRKIEEFIQLIDSPKRVKTSQGTDEFTDFMISSYGQTNQFDINTPQSLNVTSSEIDFIDLHERDEKNIVESKVLSITSGNNYDDIKDENNKLNTVKQLIASTGIVNPRQHLKIICKLPHSSSTIFPLTWSHLYSSSMGSKERDFIKWNELKEKLLAENLLETRIVENCGKTHTRSFRLFYTKEEEQAQK